MNYFASDDGNSSFSHGQTDTDTVGSTVSGISHGHTAHAPTFSATSLGPSLKKGTKKIRFDLMLNETSHSHIGNN